MTRPNGAARRRRAGAPAGRSGAVRRPAVPPPPPAPTPLPAGALLDHAAEIRELLDEVADLTGSGNAWAPRILRRNVELALRGPRTVESAENQVDFVEELAAAVWDDADPGFRQAVPAAPTPEATRAREARRQEIVERLDHLTDQLCRAVEAWRGLAAVAGEGTPTTTADPHVYHSI